MMSTITQPVIKKKDLTPTEKSKAKAPMVLTSLGNMALLLTASIFALKYTAAFLYGPLFFWIALVGVYTVIVLLDVQKPLIAFRAIFFTAATISAILFVTSLVLLANNLAVDKGFYKRQDNSKAICIASTGITLVSMLTNALVYWSITHYEDAQIDYDNMIAALHLS